VSLELYLVALDCPLVGKVTENSSGFDPFSNQVEV
jgi:hypothetical protein